MSISFVNQVCIITGATSGIGLAVVQELAAGRARLILVGRIDVLINSAGLLFKGISLDCTDAEWGYQLDNPCSKRASKRDLQKLFEFSQGHRSMK